MEKASEIGHRAVAACHSPAQVPDPGTRVFFHPQSPQHLQPIQTVAQVFGITSRRVRLLCHSIGFGMMGFCQLAVMLLIPVASAAQAGNAPAIPAVLRTIREVSQLNNDQARSGYPVHLQAVITYSDLEWGALFIQDDTGAVYINVHGMAAAYPVGTRVKVDAVTGAGDLLPVLIHPKIEVLGWGQLPPPAQWTLRELDNKAADSKWVETRGVLRPTNQHWDRISFRLVDGPVEAVVVVPQAMSPDALGLIDSIVKVRAVCGSVIDSNGKRIGTQLFVPSLKDIGIEERGLPDPFAVPPRPIATLSRTDAEPPLVHWLHVRGEVTWESPGTFFVADTSGAICVQGKKDQVVHTGDLLDVVGFPALGEYGITLADGQLRRAQEAPEGGRATALRLSAAEVLKTSLHGRLVKLRARLMEQTENPTEHVFLLEDGDQRFSAVLPKANAGARVVSLPVGSILELTGVAVIQDATPGQPRSLLVMIGSAADLALIESNRWLTAKNALFFVAGVAVLVFSSLAWIWLLRQRVRQQTATIRARLEHEAELESVYRRLFQRNLAGVYRATLDGRILDCNLALASMFGYACREDFIGQEIVGTYVTPEDRKVFVAQLTAEKEVSNREARYRRRDGSDLWVIENTTLVQGTGGSASVIEGTLLDITRRKQAEEARLASEKLFRGAFDQAANGMLLTAIDGTLVKANAAFCALVGYSENELQQRRFVDITHPEDRAEGLELVQRMLAGELESARVEKRYIHKTGSIVWAEMSPSLVRDSNGRPRHFITHVTDITQRRQIADQLLRAKDAAVAASTAKSQFLANMSHEIRTPMNGVMGMVEMALDTELTPEQREFLGMAKTSADALLGVINDVLDFSKIEAGKLDLDPIPFNLRDHLAQTLKPLALRADQKGLELTCEIRPEVPEEIVADPTRLRQILVNLLGNAIKFTERGEVGLEVGVVLLGEEQAQLHFAVRDTGVGIALEKQKLIFEAFAQADGSTTRTFGGTGLGLTISSRLVEIMGGQIGVESRRGEGSCFRFRVPARIARPAAPPQAVERAELVGLRALVVDDNLTNRRILGNILERWRMKPVLAASGREALARLQEAQRTGNSFALLMTDSQMPEMDGFEFVEQIREKVDLGKTTIMMLTSAGQRGDGARCRELGITAYLVKPVSQSQLLGAIIRVLGTKVETGEEPRLVTRHSLEPPPLSLRVLLAEDNRVNQKLASRLMEKRGHRVVVAENGREALEALEKQTFDLVVMDVSMPEMDGFEAAAAIRAREKGNGSHLPIIAMTALAMKGDRERCLAAGMDGYVSKPVQSKELFQAIESLLPAAASSER